MLLNVKCFKDKIPYCRFIFKQSVRIDVSYLDVFSMNDKLDAITLTKACAKACTSAFCLHMTQQYLSRADRAL